MKPFPNIFASELKKIKPGLDRTIWRNGCNIISDCYPDYETAIAYWEEENNDIVDNPRYKDKLKPKRTPEELIFAQSRLVRTEQDIERIALGKTRKDSEKEGDIETCKHCEFILPEELKKMKRPQMLRLCEIHVEDKKKLKKRGKVDELRLRIAMHFQAFPHGPDGHSYSYKDMKHFRPEEPNKQPKRPRVYDLSGGKKKKKRRGNKN